MTCFRCFLIAGQPVILYKIINEEVIVFLLEGKPFVWRPTETSDILPEFPYKVSRIRNASV